MHGSIKWKFVSNKDESSKMFALVPCIIKCASSCRNIQVLARYVVQCTGYVTKKYRTLGNLWLHARCIHTCACWIDFEHRYRENGMLLCSKNTKTCITLPQKWHNKSYLSRFHRVCVLVKSLKEWANWYCSSIFPDLSFRQKHIVRQLLNWNVQTCTLYA